MRMHAQVDIDVCVCVLHSFRLESISASETTLFKAGVNE